MSLARLMVNSVDLYRPTNTQGMAAGTVRTMSLVTAGLACSLQPAKVSRIITQGREGIDISHTSYFDADPVCKIGDELRMSGHIYYCQGPSRDEAGRGVVWAVDLKERK